MFDSLFLVLISIFVPIIVFTGFKIYKCINYKKFLIVLSLVLLALEIIRFFCNAAFYQDAETPSYDLKFGFITVLCILSLFATFNNSKIAGGGFRSVFVLTSLAPIVLGLFNPNVYVNALDVNGVCKAIYMIESGVTLTIALFYVLDKDMKIGAWNILWASLFVLIFVGIDALTIWYWKINTAFDLMWYLSWLIVILTIPVVFGINQIYHLCKEKRNKQKDLNVSENVTE